jgi:hypothetical protein
MIRKRLNFYKKFFLHNEIDEVILPYLYDIHNELPLFTVAVGQTIDISLFDEGVFPDFISKLYTFNSSKISKLKIFIKNLILKLIINDRYFRIFLDKGYDSDFTFKNYYSSFVDLYPYQNLENRILIKLEFPANSSRMESLFLTSCLSEDGIISLEEEIDLIGKIYSNLPKNTHIKFHPRDSDQKKDLILSKYSFSYDASLDLLPSEFLLNNEYIKVLGGYLTTTLLLATLLKNGIAVNSYIALISSDKIDIEYLKTIKIRFPDINFIEY